MDKTRDTPAVLYIVATPIGNLDDISRRALQVLETVPLIAAEDTRHSRKLLTHYGIEARLFALHEHNEQVATAKLLKALLGGDEVALVSDAGTPLISDPGFYLVRAARQAGIRVVPLPGPSACIAALSVAGLPTDRFVFEGFLPARSTARKQRLSELASEKRTLVFYESSHRICESLADMAENMGSERQVTVARELTKTFETIKGGSLAELVVWVQADSNQQKGEFVVILQGAPARNSDIDETVEQVLTILLAELPLKQAASLAAKITGLPKNRLYEAGLVIKEKTSGKLN